MPRQPISKGATQSSPSLDAALRVAVAKDAVVVYPMTITAEQLAGERARIGKASIVAALADDAGARDAIAKSDLHGFTLAAHPGLVFASSEPLADRDGATVVVKVAPQTRILKDTGEERFVFGVVLEPDVVDAQNDTYSAEEVRKAAHRWMEQNNAQLGKQHAEIVTGKLKVLESYVAPVDFAVGEQTVKKGAWVMAIRVVDDDMWAAVKKGEFTGFSIGGSAIRTPEVATPT